MTEIGAPVVTRISVHLFKEIFSTLIQKHVALLQALAQDKGMLRIIYQAEVSNATKYAHNLEISHKMSDLMGNLAASSLAAVAYGYLEQ